MSRILYIGAPEADAETFRARMQTDLPSADLFATNQREQAFDHLDDCEVLIGHHFQFDERLLAHAPKLRWVQSLTSGTDAIVKLPSLRREVLLTSTRGIHGPQMSELVFLGMLALTRDYPRMLDNQRARRWERWPQSLLAGKTAVIVGVGAIAEALAPRCKAFGMSVYGVTASPRPLQSFDGMYSREQLQQAAAAADYLIIVVPYSAATDNLIDAQVLSAMRPSAFLLNVARGAVLDEGALIAALKQRRIAGASLDVFRQTPLPADSPLWHQDHLLITPQIGGMSDVYLDQCYPLVLTNLQHYLAGRSDQLLNLVSH